MNIPNSLSDYRCELAYFLWFQELGFPWIFTTLTNMKCLKWTKTLLCDSAKHSVLNYTLIMFRYVPSFSRSIENVFKKCCAMLWALTLKSLYEGWMINIWRKSNTRDISSLFVILIWLVSLFIWEFPSLLRVKLLYSSDRPLWALKCVKSTCSLLVYLHLSSRNFFICPQDFLLFMPIFVNGTFSPSWISREDYF